MTSMLGFLSYLNRVERNTFTRNPLEKQYFSLSPGLGLTTGIKAEKIGSVVTFTKLVLDSFVAGPDKMIEADKGRQPK